MSRPVYGAVNPIRRGSSTTVAIELRLPHWVQFVDPNISSPTSANKNVQTIAQLESQALLERSLVDRISDAITRFAGSGVFIAFHVIGFTVWIVVNLGQVRSIRPFDSFPFMFLTTVVSLEAIFLSIFVLISQNRMTRQADRRAHLDLQINLLAEEENTMMLRMLRSLCEHHGIQPELPTEDVRALFKKTDLQKLMRDLHDQLPDA
jgi:uncharacterized membrane protein